MKIAPAIPVIGPFLYRRSVRALAGALKNGDIPAVRSLAGIATTSADLSAREIARDALSSLPSQDAIDAFCNEVLVREDTALEELSVAREYAPAEPGQKALFLYITGQEEACCRFDPGARHPLLARGYAAAPGRIRARAVRRAADPRMARMLTHALIGTDPVRSAGRWSYDEWVTICSGLAAGSEWSILWVLVASAPPSLAVAVLHAMMAAGWSPGGDAGPVFDELAACLPERWASPAPEKPLHTRGNEDSRCLRLAFSRDGSLLASGTCDGGIAVWQVSSARLLASFTTEAGSISFLAFTLDNTCLVLGGDRGSLHGFGIPSGDAIWSYADQQHRVSAAVMSVDGEEILAGDHRGGIVCLGCRTGTILRVSAGPPSPVTAIAQASGGTRTAAGHACGTICCRDAGTVSWTVPGTGDGVRSLAFTGPAGQLMVVHEHSSPSLLEGSTGETLQTYAGYPGQATCHATDSDHCMTAIGSDDHVIRLWNRPERDPAAEIPFYNRLPTCCALAPGATLLAAGCNEGTVYFFHLPDGQRIKEFRGYKRPVTACAISPDGTLLATAGGDGAVTFRGIPSGELLRTLRHPAGAVTALAPASGSGGAGIVAGTADGRVRLFPQEEGTMARSIDTYTPAVRALAVSHDGAYLACAGSDTSLRIWDLAKGGLVATCEGLNTTVRCLAFLPDGTTLVSGGWDGEVRFWDVPGGNASGTRAGHSSIITCCCVDAEGTVLVTGSNDTTVRVWQLNGEKKCTILEEAEKEVSACAISPDGMLLAVAGSDPLVRLYHLPEAAAAGTIPQVPGKPTALAFSGDGLSIAAGYDTGTLAFYDVHGHSLIRTLHAHTGAVTGIVAMRGGDCIVTSGTDGMIRTFRSPFMRPLSRTTLADLSAAREQEQAAETGAMAEQWRFLHRLLSLRFQDEIEICPAFRDAGMYDIQIVG